MRLLSLLAALVLGAILAACATLSEEQCQAGDWRSIGQADGARGRPANYVSNHIDACSEYGIGLDQALYDAGRQEGLGSYCRLDVAAREGRRGDRYYGVCEGSVGLAFARVHRAGLEIYELEAELNSVESEISSLVRRLGQSGSSEEQVASLRREIRSLEREASSIARQIRFAERQLVLIQSQEQARLARV